MRKLFLAVSLLTFAAAGLAGCRATAGTAAAVSAGFERARPLDNFGEILKPKAVADKGHAATSAGNLAKSR